MLFDRNASDGSTESVMMKSCKGLASLQLASHLLSCQQTSLWTCGSAHWRYHLNKA